MIKRSILGAGTVIAIALSGGAAAADAGWYLGGSLGQSRFDVDTSGFTGSVDKRDTAWSLFGGYQMNRNLGLELGYTDFGKATFNGTLGLAIPPVPAGAGARGGIDATAWWLAAVGTIPFTERLSGYGKLGLNYNEVKLNATVGGFSGSTDDRNVGYLGGLGLKYNFTPSIGLRGGWERHRVGDDSVGGKGDIDLWSLGLHVRF